MCYIVQIGISRVAVLPLQTPYARCCVSMNLVKAFGISVRIAREHLKLTQGQLANSLGLQSTQIGRIERGEKLSRIDTMEAVAKGLDIELSELVRRAEGLQRLRLDERKRN